MSSWLPLDTALLTFSVVTPETVLLSLVYCFPILVIDINNVELNLNTTFVTPRCSIQTRQLSGDDE